MSSNGLSAAALLMNVTSNERAKISHKITSNGFSHELAQIERYQTSTPHVSTTSKSHAPVENDSAAVLKPADTRLVAVHKPVNAADAISQTEKTYETVAGGRGKEMGKAGQAKAKALSEQKAQESLYITDLVALERVMAQLRLSADARQACQGASDKQGRMPIKALRSMLLSQSGVTGANGADTVAAQDVMELLASLRQVQNGNASMVQSLNMKSSGTYSIAELTELLKNVVQTAADHQQKSTPLVEQKSNTVPVPELQSASTEIEQALIPGGQLERLASQRIPTFSKGLWGTADKSGGADESSLEAPRATTPAAMADVAASSEAPSIPDGLKPALKTVGEVMKDDLLTLNSTRLTQSDAADSSEAATPDTASVDSVAKPMVADAPNSPGTSWASQTPGQEMRVLEHRFASDQAEVGAQTGSHPETTLSASRAGLGDEISRPAELDPEALTGRGAPERVSGPGGHQMESGGSHTGTTGEKEGSKDSFHSTLSGLDDQLRAGDGTQTHAVGFDRALAEGAAAGHSAQVGQTGAQDEELQLRLSESTWPDALSRQIEDSHRRGRSQMTIELEPASLGKLVLRIEADRNHVTAWVSTQSEETKGLLLNGASSLRQHLEEHGLTLGQFTVDVGQGGEQRFARGGSGSRQRAAASRVEGTQRVGMNADLPRQVLLAPDRLLSVFA